VMNGLDGLKALRGRGNSATVILITAYGTIDRAVQAMKAGAYDFITKPFDLDHIAAVVHKALEQQKFKTGFERLAEEAGARHQLVGGDSPAMRRAVATARAA